MKGVVSFFFGAVGAVILLLSASPSQSQEILKPKNDSFSKVYFQPALAHLHGLDSIQPFQYRVDSFHLSYYPDISKFRWMLNLGNTGSPSMGLAFRIRPHEGFSMGNHVFDLMEMDPSFIPLLRVKVPFTRLNYAQGATELLQVGASFSHNIKPNWNVGLDFRRMKSDGFYLNQAMGLYNSRFFTWYHNKNGRYHLAAQAVINRIQNDENGGITSDSLFEGVNTSVRVVPVNLGNSQTSAMQTIKGTHYVLHQQFRLGRQVSLPYMVPTQDPGLADSIMTFLPGLVINSQTSYNSRRWMFTDPQNPRGFFDEYRFDTVTTYDSTRQRNLTNRFVLSNSPVRYVSESRTLVPVNYLFNAYSVVDAIFLDGSPGWKEDYLNISAGVNASNNHFYDTLNTLNVKMEYYFTGYNAGDWQVQAMAGRRIKSWNVAAELQMVNRSPYYSSVFLNNNNFGWNNRNFTTTYSRGIFLHAGHKADPGYPILTVGWQVISRPIYFETNGAPVQNSGDVAVSTLRLRKRLSISRRWIWDQHWEFQSSTNERAIRIPGLLVFHSVYFQSELFKGNMMQKTGFEGYYFSEFFAQEYNPSTRQFQLQDRVLIGNYPMIEFFTSFRVKTFRFFFRTEHLTQNLFGRRSYASPHQPLPPRTFRFGISWWFFD